MESSWLNYEWQRAGVGTYSRKSLGRREQDCLREILREARESSGMSRRELSSKVGLTSHAIAKIERGVRLVDVVELIDIAEALNLDPADFVSEVMRRR